jgi:hypothetical protein
MHTMFPAQPSLFLAHYLFTFEWTLCTSDHLIREQRHTPSICNAAFVVCMKTAVACTCPAALKYTIASTLTTLANSFLIDLLSRGKNARIVLCDEVD